MVGLDGNEGGAWRRALATGIAGIALHPAMLAAQTIPPSTPLSTVDQAIPSREEVTPPAPTAATQAPRVTVDSRAAIARPDCPFEQSEIRLTLTRVELTRPDGSPLQPAIARTLAPLTMPLGDQSVRVICTIRDEANALLARKGWIASVQAPQQRITDGVLRLNVVTARITEIRTRGEAGPYRALLERRLAELRTLDPVNQRQVERLLLLAGDAPGLDIQLSLRPAGTAPGEVIGEIALTFQRFAVTTAVQNANASTLGRTSIYSRAELYGLTGQSDLTYLGASTTTDFREQRVLQGGHLFGIGGGATAGGRVTYAWSRPDLGALDLRTGTLIGGLDLAVPLVRSIGANLRGAVGVDYVDQRTTVRSGDLSTVLNLDKTRTAFARLSGDSLGHGGGMWPDTSFSAGLELRRGLAILGASRPNRVVAGALPSRIQGDARATVLRADMDAVIGTGALLNVLASVRAQWASRPLLAYDEFSIGNLTIGRGYDPGSNSGDRAVGMRVEVRLNPPVSRTVMPQIFVFTDAVLLTNLDTGASEVDRRLRSVGAGVRLLIANRIAAEVSYAKPVDRALLINGSPPPDRLLLSLIVQGRGRTQR